MRRLTVMIILSCWLPCAASAQSYFNKRETLHSFSVFSSAVLNANGKLYTASTCIDSVNDLGNWVVRPIQGLRLTIHNANGDILRDTFYQQIGVQLYTPSNSLLQLPNKDILLPASGDDTSGPTKLELLCFDSSGNFKWIKQYDKPYCTALIQGGDYWSVNDFKPDGYGNWLVLSTFECGVFGQWGYGRALLTKLDSNFNVIWHKPFGDQYNSSVGRHLLVDSNQYTFLSSYSNFLRVNKGFSTQPEIFKTDTAGNQIWHWRGDSTRLIGATDFVRTKDGGYAFCGAIGKDVPDGNMTSSTVYSLPWMEKIDASGNFLWGDTISQCYSNSRNAATRIMELSNGDIVSAGNMVGGGFGVFDTVGEMHGFLIRTKADGTVKWKKKYRYGQGDSLLQYVNDMKRTDDGGYVLAGEATEYYYQDTLHLPWQRAWLIKVDSNGCASTNDPQCWPVAVGHEPLVTQVAYNVYPNPVTEQLTVSFRKEQNADETFMLSDVTGRIVAQTKLSGSFGKASLDVRDLSQGIYLYRILNNGAIVASGKVSKQ